MPFGEIELVKLIDNEMKRAGFKRKGKNWYLETDETVEVVNLQKSQWGNQYYVNLGILLKALDQSNTPKEYQCHIRARLNDVADEAIDWGKILDLEDASVVEEQRATATSNALRDNALPFLRKMSTTNGIKHELSDKGFGNLAVMQIARRFLGLPET